MKSKRTLTEKIYLWWHRTYDVVCLFFSSCAMLFERGFGYYLAYGFDSSRCSPNSFWTGSCSRSKTVQAKEQVFALDLAFYFNIGADFFDFLGSIF